MKIANVRVYDLGESIKASKYPLAVDTEDCSQEITATTVRLAKSGKGEGHDQFLTGIRVAFDLTCSIKMWVEMERYRFVEFVSSQSTMHRLSQFDLAQQYNGYVDPRIIAVMEELQGAYNNTKDKEDYLRLLYSCPVGLQLTARLTTNYRALKTVYSQRHHHRLPEWPEFCRWIATLPRAEELIIG